MWAGMPEAVIDMSPSLGSVRGRLPRVVPDDPGRTVGRATELSAAPCGHFEAIRITADAHGSTVAGDEPSGVCRRGARYAVRVLWWRSGARAHAGQLQRD